MGAICEHCHGDMMVVDGCIRVPIETKKALTLEPIQYGKETREYFDGVNPERCHDCGAKLGGYHHPGCDWEQCPNCHGQLFSCDCQKE